jgi:hypothetical protein
LSYILKKKIVFIPLSFLVINDCNQGKTLCSPCISTENEFEIIDVLVYIGICLSKRNKAFLYNYCRCFKQFSRKPNAFHLPSGLHNNSYSICVTWHLGNIGEVSMSLNKLRVHSERNEGVQLRGLY